MSLSRQQVNSISRKVYQQFPELDGATPNVKPQSVSSKIPTKGPHSQDLTHQRYLLTYSADALLPGGRTMMRIVRAVANGKGKLLKITTSK